MPFPKKKLFVQSQSVNLSTKNRVIFLNSKVEAVSYVFNGVYIKLENYMQRGLNYCLGMD